MTVPGVFEMAPGADPTADPDTYTWTGLTALTAQNEITIGRGRRARGVAVSDAATSQMLLGNNGDLTPYKPTSQYSPHIRKGLRVRHYINVGDRYLSVNGAVGARASTPDAASLDIVGDLFLAVEIRSPTRIPTVAQVRHELVGKWNPTGNQRAYYLAITSDGRLVLFWSTTGADAPSAISTLPIRCPDQGPVTYAVHLDADNGDGGHTARFWCITGTLAQLLAQLAADETRIRLGDPFVGVGVTSIFASTATLEIGNVSPIGDAAYRGGFNKMQLRAGDWTGTVAANPDFTIQTAGATSFADTAAVPKTWTINSPATISNRKVRLMGELISNGVLLPGLGVTGTAQVRWDIAGVLHRLDLGERALESALFQRITSPELAASVDAYWPMEDGRDATQFATPIAGQRPITIVNGMSLSSDSTLPASKPLPSVSANDPWSFDVKVENSTADLWEVTWLVKIPTPSTPTADRILTVYASGSARSWIIQQDATNGVTLSALDQDDGGLLLDVLPWNVDFQYWSIVQLAIDQNGGNIDYILRWIPIQGPGAGGVSSMSGSFAATAGRVTRVAKTATGNAPPDGISMGHVAVTSGMGESWLAGADSGYNGEPAARRVWRICREQNIPVLIDGAYGATTTANLAAGEQAMGPQPITSVLGALEECAKVSNGYLGEATELFGLTFRSGWTLRNPVARLTSTVTVPPFEPSDDTSHVVNDATVTRPNGSSARHVDTAHQALEGAFKDSRDRNVQADWQLPHHASWWVHESTAQEIAIPGFTMELAKNPALVNTWLGVSLGDAVTLSNLPPVMPASTATQLVEGFEETISPHLHTVKVNGRPASPWNVTVVGDAVSARLGSGGSQLNSSFVAGTATSMAVLVTLGSGWETAAGSYPQDVNVGGARVTVSAVGAPAAGVQTFTVSATISNGVNYTVPAGTAVFPWRPAVVSI